MPGFGHAGLGGSLGWADPANGLSFGFVHNRLLTPFVVADQAGFVATAALIRRGAAAPQGIPAGAGFGAPFASSRGLSPGRALRVFHSEADLQRHLEVSDGAVGEVTAD